MSNRVMIPVASGKGGVGKTFLTANLAIALAEKGLKTLAVDLDLGGSNLFSFLGLPNQYPGVGDFLKARVSELEDLIVPTGIDNLGFLAGQGRTPFLANIPYAQKIRLMQHIRRLPAQYVLLDLGAGTAFNVLDFFRTTQRGIVVTTPDYPAIMGMLGFLKHGCLRNLARTFSKNPPVRERIEALFRKPMSDNRITVEHIRREVARVDPQAGETVARLAQELRPRIIFNRGEHPEEMEAAVKIDETLRNVLSMEVDYFGFVCEDPEIRQCLKQGVPFLSRHKERPASEALRQIADRVVRFWDQTIPNSARRIQAHAAELY
ncbi:MAG: P-loop NTPase [Desulfobacteraceae bacterium]|jgi:flagellar biosynthesis protein FlhG